MMLLVPLSPQIVEGGDPLLAAHRAPELPVGSLLVSKRGEPSQPDVVHCHIVLREEGWGATRGGRQVCFSCVSRMRWTMIKDLMPAAMLLMTAACTAPTPQPAADVMQQPSYEAPRRKMVAEQIERRGIRDARVLDAMRKVSRDQFVPESEKASAYEDHPLPIGQGQTISQPYIVAYMTEALELEPGEKVLEIGTGSGYQAAVLAELVKEVYSIEIVPELAREAENDLRAAGYGNVQVRHGDGYAGWPEHAPFDAIIVTAAPDHVPPALVEQLAVGGKLVIPVGDFYQDMMILTRTEKGVIETKTIAVRFVPMTGKAQEN